MIHIDRIIDSQRILPFEDYSNELIPRKSRSLGTYYQYVGCTNHNLISEVSLHKMLDLLKGQDYVILSANLQLSAVHENILRNRILRAEVNDWNMGVYQLIGHWTEAPDGLSHSEAERKGVLRHAIEKIYAIPCVDMSHEDFIKFLTSLNVIAGVSQPACIIHANGGEFQLAIDNENDQEGYSIAESAQPGKFDDIVLSYAKAVAPMRGITGDYCFHLKGMEIPSHIQNRLMFKRNKIRFC